MNIPVYIISFNRLDALARSIESYLRFFEYDDFVLIDNGSDYPPLLEYLEELEKLGATVIRRDKITLADDLNRAWEDIEPINRKRKASHYVVTDPDIDLAGVPDDFMEILLEFHRIRNIQTAGPLLKLDDIPDEYPAKRLVCEQFIPLYLRKVPKRTTISGKHVYYQYALIDSTFGLLNAKVPFRRLRRGVRLYPPYDARHLDWYVTPQTMQSDHKHFHKTTTVVSHWLGGSLYEESSIKESEAWAILPANDGLLEQNILSNKKRKFDVPATYWLRDRLHDIKERGIAKAVPGPGPSPRKDQIA